MKWDNVTYRLRTPDGNAIISIAEDDNKNISHITFQIGKAGSSVNAYCYALAQTVSYIIRDKGLNVALELLSGITSDRAVSFQSGIICRSGVEALYIALIDWRNAQASRRPLIPRPPKFARLK